MCQEVYILRLKSPFNSDRQQETDILLHAKRSLMENAINYCVCSSTLLCFCTVQHKAHYVKRCNPPQPKHHPTPPPPTRLFKPLCCGIYMFCIRKRASQKHGIRMHQHPTSDSLHPHKAKFARFSRLGTFAPGLPKQHPFKRNYLIHAAATTNRFCSGFWC